MEGNLKSKIAGGMKWTGLESFVNTGLGFLIGIVIARRLSPSDYGVMGMLTIFLAISNTFLNSGISQALIQKKDVNDDDLSTAIFFNLAVGVCFYIILFFIAPFIAEFYRQPILTPVTRVTGLTLILTALCMVQNAILSIRLDFRSKARNTLTALIVSGVAAMIMAYAGFGVWTLVWQGIISLVTMCVLLWVHTNWHPGLSFKKKSFKALFGFGSKHLASGLIDTVYSNISTLVIGKFYQATDLGYYTRASSTSSLPGNFIMGIIQKVNYPVLSKLQDDRAALLSVYSVLLRTPLFIVYPCIAGMAALAWPLTEVLLGIRWLPSATMMIILCLGCLFNPLTSVNLNLLYVKGRTDLVLKLELIKKPIAFAMIMVAIPMGIYGMCLSISLYNFIAFCFNCHYTGKILNYGFKRQIMDVLPIMGYCVLMAGTVLLTTYWLPYAWLKLLVGIPVGIVVYLFVARLNRDVTLQSLVNNIVQKSPKLSWLNCLVIQ